ncbi:MAG: glycerate kinase [Pseudomonadota bacterium]
MTDTEIQNSLLALFDEAVAAADPANCVPQHLPPPPKGRTLLIAAGKAAASMAHAVEQVWPADAPLSGIALTRYGHGMECTRVTVIEAAHPVPDNRGYEAALNIMTEVEALGADDLLLFLASGGGSSLLALPAEGLSLEDKKAINKDLLMSGAPIGEMNTVRKHLSAIKGGRLATAAAPACVVTLGISDVPFDDPSTIASGPTVPDTTTLADANEIIARYGIKPARAIMDRLQNPEAETPKPDHPAFKNARFTMVATPGDMLNAVVEAHKSGPLPVVSLGADIEGEASTIGAQHAALALEHQKSKGGGLIMSGGETTVTVVSDDAKPAAKPARGGRNCEYLLALAVALDGAQGIHAIAADTDGIDGSEDNAGAVIAPDTLERARGLELDAKAMLAGHDSYSFFEALGDLVTTGPTRTNVNDFRAIWIEN